MDFTKYENKLEYPTRNVPNYQEKRKEYRKESYRLEALFKEDALREVDLTNHPKANKAYEMAWAEGHSEGLEQVFKYLENYADLML